MAEPQRRDDDPPGLPGMPGTHPNAIRRDEQIPSRRRAPAIVAVVLLHPLTWVLVGGLIASLWFGWWRWW